MPYISCPYALDETVSHREEERCRIVGFIFLFLSHFVLLSVTVFSMKAVAYKTYQCFNERYTASLGGK